MKRLNKMMAIMTFVLIASISAQDIAGDYRLNGVNVRYTGLSREAGLTQVIAWDVYGINLGFILAEIMPMDGMYSVVNGPFSASALDLVGVSLNMSMYDDGTGAIHEGSSYPTVELDEETCITAATVLPVTDYLEYDSDMANVGGNVAQTTPLFIISHLFKTLHKIS